MAYPVVLRILRVVDADMSAWRELNPAFTPLIFIHGDVFAANKSGTHAQEPFASFDGPVASGS
jgi:hypothetical protein